MKARIRSIKPEVFTDEHLWDLGVETGMPVLQAFEGLWCHADREGRFEWRPRALKTGILPYYDGDFGAVLDALCRAGFVVYYEVDGRPYGLVRTFTRHQIVNNREAPSELPPPPPLTSRGAREGHATTTRGARDDDAGKAEGKGTEQERKGTREDLDARALGHDDAPEPEPLPQATGTLTEPGTITWLPEAWKPGADLYADGVAAGCTAAGIDEFVAYWRGRKLGGEWKSPEAFVRAKLASIRDREAAARAKARAAATGGGYRNGTPPADPVDIDFDPRMPGGSSRELCRDAGLNVDALGRKWLDGVRAQGITSMPRAIATKQFEAYVRRVIAEQRKGAG